MLLAVDDVVEETAYVTRLESVGFVLRASASRSTGCCRHEPATSISTSTSRAAEAER
jgi:hypothetical protein